MKTALLPGLLTAALFVTSFAFAQTPAVTATCKDGSSFSGTTRSGACRGHKGVATWNPTSPVSAPGASAPGASAPGIAPAAAPATQSASTTPTQPPAAIPNRQALATSGSASTAAGKVGGPGQVWVNNTSKIYHCPGDRYYGKTKSGEFMSLSAAQAAGDRPAAGKACPS
jgi:hypothetical protein